MKLPVVLTISKSLIQSNPEQGSKLLLTVVKIYQEKVIKMKVYTVYIEFRNDLNIDVKVAAESQLEATKIALSQMAMERGLDGVRQTETCFAVQFAEGDTL